MISASACCGVTFFAKRLNSAISASGEEDGAEVGLFEALKKGLFVQVFGRLIGKTKSAIYKRKNNISGPTSIDIEYSYKYTKSYMPMISDKKYDLAIGFSTPYYFVD